LLDSGVLIRLADALVTAGTGDDDALFMSATGVDGAVLSTEVEDVDGAGTGRL
jgi:hypothetical protein